MISPAPRGAIIAMVLGAAGLAFATYTPWVGRPFDIRDFSEFLPLLRREQGVFAQFSALVDYYVSVHGRLNVVTYAALAVKWTLLGETPMLWYWLRFIQMSLLIGGVYLLARRLGASWLGAAAGASLLVSSRAAQEAIVRVTTGEPLGLCFMLGAALMVTDRRWLSGPPAGAAAAAAALVAAAILTKEMLVAWVPALLLLSACYREDGQLGFPRWTAHTRHLVVAVSAVTLLIGAAVLLAAVTRDVNEFTASYRMAGVRVERFPLIVNQMIMPENTAGRQVRWLQPPNLFFAVTCLAGLTVAFSRPQRRQHAWWMAAVSIGLPVTGALLYLPWPFFLPFYALPFIVGPSLLLAMGVTAVEHQAPGARWAVYAGAAGVALLAAMASGYLSRVAIAQQQVNGELAHLLPRYAFVDSILVAQPFAPREAWQGWGPALAMYARSVGAASRLPPTVNITCGDLPRVLQGRLGNTLVISYSFYCGSVPDATLRLRRVVTFLDYVTLSVETDTVGADLIAP